MNRVAFLVLVAALLVPAACNGDDPVMESPGADSSPAGESPTPDDDAAMDDDTESAVAIGTSDSEFGVILVDGDGRTLYVFDRDEQGQSACYDDCAANWPPLTVDGDDPEVGGDADSTLVGTTERDDGSTQVTYDGQPLYHFSGDQAPGDVNGQGVGGVWWVVGPDGEPIEQ